MDSRIRGNDDGSSATPGLHPTHHGLHPTHHGLHHTYHGLHPASGAYTTASAYNTVIPGASRESTSTECRLTTGSPAFAEDDEVWGT